MRFRPDTILVAAFVAAFAVEGRAAAQAVGFLHLPSTVPQYFGWGYGAGHHAPIVRTPAQRPDRMPRMAAPPSCAAPLGPASYEPIGCYGDACAPAAAVQMIQPPIEAARSTPGAARVAPAAMATTAPGPSPPQSRPAPLSRPAALSPPVAMRPTPFGWR